MDRLQAMRHFVTVADCGSFSGAARQLRIGQPALSKSVALLEERLGVCLIMRSTRSHSLTEAGQRFYDGARLALDEADAAEAAARDEAGSFSGSLRIAAPPVYASQVVIPLLSDFQAQHPDIRIELILDDRRIDLVEEGVDLALRTGALGDSSLLARRIDRAARMLVASPAYLAEMGSPGDPDGLSDHRIISFASFDSRQAWTFERAGTRKTAYPADPLLRVNAAEGLRAAALAGLGIAMVTNRMVGANLARGELVALLPDWTLGNSDIWVIFPEGRRVRPRARLFAEWLASVVPGLG
ncbi:LysR family transcriptional regulator [Blastomonas natatoria]|uniref:LysR family transcriptional regulator n=1 Tax=Blastomonas natatoria TaxID=34015 RepID=A0A2V3V9A1_9SPHN|nr:LysR family transcriptional regulator [Blastomonas natatoria]PXW78402.1 LysR family transcriptional regulator [Blastomonas natatoria]